MISARTYAIEKIEIKLQDVTEVVLYLIWELIQTVRQYMNHLLITKRSEEYTKEKLMKFSIKN